MKSVFCILLWIALLQNAYSLEQYFVSDVGVDGVDCGSSADLPCRSFQTLFHRIHRESLNFTLFSGVEILVSGEELDSFCGLSFNVDRLEIRVRGVTNSARNPRISCSYGDSTAASAISLHSTSAELSFVNVSFGLFTNGIVFQENGVLKVLNVDIESQTIQRPLFQLRNGYIEIENSAFLNLSFPSSSGVIRLAVGNVSIIASEFEQISATDGAAIYGESVSLFAEASNFSKCSAISGSGGAIFLGAESEMRLSLSRFSHNQASQNGGAILLGSKSSAHVTNCSFDNMMAENGGVIALLTNCSWFDVGSYYRNNMARASGGAFRVLNNVDSAFLSFLEVSFFRCLALTSAGGVLSGYHMGTTSQFGIIIVDCSLSHCSAKRDGGAISLRFGGDGDFLTILNSSISRCDSLEGYGGGIYISTYDSSENFHFFASNLVCLYVTSAKGGGLYISGAGKAHVYEVILSTFIECIAHSGTGGALHTNYIMGSESLKLEVFRSSFVSCSSSQAGGALFISEYAVSSSIALLELNFFDCISRLGGCVFIEFGSPFLKLIMERCDFQISHAEIASWLYVHVHAFDLQILISDNYFSSGTANDRGIFFYVGSTSGNHLSIDVISNVIDQFYGNYYGPLGFLLIEGSDAEINVFDTVFVSASTYLGGLSLIEHGNLASVKVSVHFSIFLDCYSYLGGGLYGEFKSKVIVDAVSNGFINCSATAYGGGVFLRLSSNYPTIILKDNMFFECSAWIGGAIFIFSDTSAAFLLFNQSVDSCKGAEADGGMFFNSTNVDILFSMFQNTFQNGFAPKRTGCACIFMQEHFLGDIWQSTFRNCTSIYGAGGLYYVSYGYLRIHNSTFTSNIGAYGGAMRVLGFSSSITRLDLCYFFNNQAKSLQVDRGFYISNLELSGTGAGIWMSSSSETIHGLSLIGCRLINNTADLYGGAISISKFLISSLESPLMLNLSNVLFSQNNAGFWGDNIGSPLCRFHYWSNQTQFLLGNPFRMVFELSDYFFNVPQPVVLEIFPLSNVDKLVIRGIVLDRFFTNAVVNGGRINADAHLKFSRVQYLPRDLRYLNSTWQLDVHTFRQDFPFISAQFEPPEFNFRVCPDGYIIVLVLNDLVCRPCSSGTYSLRDRQGYLRCETCEIGKYSRKASSTCLNCSAGEFAGRKGSISCEFCPAGRYSSSTGNSGCEYCAPGTFNELSGQSSCTNCMRTSHNDEMPCKGCVESDIGAKSRSDCFCSEGYFGRSFLGEPCEPCSVSPEILCPKNSSLPSFLPGTFRDVNIVNTVLKCFPAESCELTGSNLETRCKIGYQGKKCGICSMNYFRSTDGKCKLCRLTFWSLIFPVFQLVAFITFVDRRWRRRSSSRSQGLLLLLLLIQRFQIIGLFPRSTNRDVSTVQAGVDSMHTVGSLLNIDFRAFSLECVWKLSFWPSYYLQVLAPYVLASFWCFFLFSLGKLLPKSHRFIRYMNKSSTYTRIARVFVSLFFLFFASSLEALLRPFQCFLQEDGTYTMVQYSSENCFDSKWFFHFPWMTLFAVSVCVVVPVLVIRAFWRHKRKFFYSRNFLEVFGLLVHPYKPQYFHWSLIELLPKMALIFLIVFSFELELSLS